MKRLTKRDEFGNADIIGVDSADLQGNLSSKEFNRVTYALNKLATYEELEDADRLIKLPCKIGDELFYIGSDEHSCDEYSDYRNLYCGKPKAPKVRSFIVKQFRVERNSIQMLNHDSLYESCEMMFGIDEIGKTVFLTREEAEGALQERKEDSE